MFTDKAKSQIETLLATKTDEELGIMFGPAIRSIKRVLAKEFARPRKEKEVIEEPRVFFDPNYEYKTPTQKGGKTFANQEDPIAEGHQRISMAVREPGVPPYVFQTRFRDIPG